ncbi:class I SAM-dependent methyltransferase [Amycolatopsis anabasis]|uniref:class I SAM-dependent methyltransferase n=1 Tax=Amycolatopsis anabasis TaxID=1840409 RepID=UPI001FE326AC|nr:class I SAM-dependent methyltransferase [Amycolatopsis anabasis]
MTNAAYFFDRTAERYDEDGFHHFVADRLVTGLNGVPSPELVLDVATGTGAAAFAAVRHLNARRVVAVDIAPAMIDRAVARAAEHDPGGVIAWQVAPAVPAPVEPASADVVLCASSLHFLGTAALADWLRVLRPGGRAAYTLPNAATFAPSGAFADLVARDLTIPADTTEAAATATNAGFTNATATLLKTPGDHPRTAFLVHATAP